jgi:hypothetical protein
MYRGREERTDGRAEQRIEQRRAELDLSQERIRAFRAANGAATLAWSSRPLFGFSMAS